MKKKIINFIFIFSILALISFLVFLSFNSKFRRNVLLYSLAGAKFYHTMSIKSSLGYEPNIEEASNKLLKYIKFSEYFSEGKNSFHSSIYEMAKFIENSISSKNEYLYLSEIVNSLIIKDPDLYMAKIWAAKISMLKNENKKTEIEDWWKENEKGILENIKLGIVLDAIGDKKGIQVLNHEIEYFFRDIASQVRRPVKKIIQESKRNGNLPIIARNIRRAKVRNSIIKEFWDRQENKK